MHNNVSSLSNGGNSGNGPPIWVSGVDHDIRVVLRDRHGWLCDSEFTLQKELRDVKDTGDADGDGVLDEEEEKAIEAALKAEREKAEAIGPRLVVAVKRRMVAGEKRRSDDGDPFSTENTEFRENMVASDRAPLVRVPTAGDMSVHSLGGVHRGTVAIYGVGEWELSVCLAGMRGGAAYSEHIPGSPQRILVLAGDPCASLCIARGSGFDRQAVQWVQASLGKGDGVDWGKLVLEDGDAEKGGASKAVLVSGAASMSAPSSVLVGAEQSFDIVLRDRWGNVVQHPLAPLVSGDGMERVVPCPIRVELQGPENIIAQVVAVPDPNDSQSSEGEGEEPLFPVASVFRVTYCLKLAGWYGMSATLGGRDHLPGSPYRIAAFAGPVAPFRSLISAYPVDSVTTGKRAANEQTTTRDVAAEGGRSAAGSSSNSNGSSSTQGGRPAGVVMRYGRASAWSELGFTDPPSALLTAYEERHSRPLARLA